MAMAGGGITQKPCIRCKARRVKCDKRLSGCAVCQKHGQPCPGYNNVRNFIDEGTLYRQRAARSQSARRGNAGDTSSVRSVSTAKNVDSAETPVRGAASCRPKSRLVSGTIGANVTVPTLGDWVYTASEQSVPNPHDPYNAASSAGPTSLDTNQNAYGTTVAAGFFSTSPKLGYGDLCAYDMVMPDIFQVGNDDSLRCMQVMGPVFGPMAMSSHAVDSDCAALTGASHVNWNWNFTSSRNEGNSGGGQAGLYVTDRDKSQGLAAAEPSLRRTINNGYMTWM